MTIEIGQIYEDMDPRNMRDGKPRRNLRVVRIPSIRWGESHVDCDSWWLDKPAGLRWVCISRERLLSTAYRLVKA